ncbi:MAG: hypothetical protein QGH45_21045, partial [Myxococcota bacterium]|nr:hypothetical protein [Myxococcota bacterium]
MGTHGAARWCVAGLLAVAGGCAGDPGDEGGPGAPAPPADDEEERDVGWEPYLFEDLDFDDDGFP